MAITLVQTKSNSGTAPTLTVTWTSNTSSGNLIVLGFESTNSLTTVTSITDSQSNTYTLIDAGTQTMDAELWYAQNITGGTTPTVTLTLSNSQACSVIVREYSGIAATALDQHISTTGNSATPSSGASGTTTQANELVIGWVGGQSSTPPTAGSGFGNLVNKVDGGGSAEISLEDQIITSTGAQTATFSGPGGPWICGVATFKATLPGKSFRINRLRPHAFSPGIAR